MLARNPRSASFLFELFLREAVPAHGGEEWSSIESCEVEKRSVGESALGLFVQGLATTP
jgi:hypothetical protein